MRGMRGVRPGGMGRMGPRRAPLYRGVWRRPLWGWYPIHGPYMWGMGCLIPIVGVATLLVLAVLRSVFLAREW